jgi:hypothetical protein
MRGPPLINARSTRVPRFNGPYLASISFRLTFTTGSAFERAAAGARRRTDGSADPRVCAQRVDWCSCTGSLRDERRCQTIDRAAGGSLSWSTSSADEPSSFGRGVHLRVGGSPQSEYWRGTVLSLPPFQERVTEIPERRETTRPKETVSEVDLRTHFREACRHHRRGREPAPVGDERLVVTQHRGGVEQVVDIEADVHP